MTIATVVGGPVGQEFEVLKIRDFGGTAHFYLLRVLSGRKREVISEADFGSETFPSDSTPLGITLGVGTRASNQAIELTAARPAFTFVHD